MYYVDLCYVRDSGASGPRMDLIVHTRSYLQTPEWWTCVSLNAYYRSLHDRAESSLRSVVQYSFTYIWLMTSLLPCRSCLRSLLDVTRVSTVNRCNYASMSRNISPPPAKRRKTSAESAVPIARQTPSVPEALPLLDTNSIRIFSWNVNGIAPFLQKSITSFFPASKVQHDEDSIPPASLRGFLQRHNWPSILFLQEVKIASKDTKTQDAVQTAVNDKLLSETGTEGPTYEAHFTLPNDPYNARGLRSSGKVYGVCSILRTDLRNQYDLKVRTVDWDKEGRISVVEIVSKSTKLAIFNIYAVNGTDNPYRDPATGAIRGTRHGRKRQVHRLLMQECLGLEAAGWEILLAGDMNVAPDSRDGYPKLRTFPLQHAVNRADFHEKLLEGKSKDGEVKGLNGIDVWRKMHEDERRYTYYSRGREWGTSCDRVDYVVASKRAWDKGMVKASGIMDSEKERGPSDHCPVWVDFCLEPETKKVGEEV
jgi:exonuclease III